MYISLSDIINQIL